jgi:C4-type Zn-finger protein
MSFVCPECQANSLAITQSIELPPDGRSDEIALQIVKCEACGFRGTAVYEESRRGAADSWHHQGYMTAQTSVNRLSKLIRQCPSPKDANERKQHLVSARLGRQ